MSGLIDTNSCHTIVYLRVIGYSAAHSWPCFRSFLFVFILSGWDSAELSLMILFLWIIWVLGFLILQILWFWAIITSKNWSIIFLFLIIFLSFLKIKVVLLLQVSLTTLLNLQTHLISIKSAICHLVFPLKMWRRVLIINIILLPKGTIFLTLLAHGQVWIIWLILSCRICPEAHVYLVSHVVELLGVVVDLSAIGSHRLVNARVLRHSYKLRVLCLLDGALRRMDGIDRWWWPKPYLIWYFHRIAINWSSRSHLRHVWIKIMTHSHWIRITRCLIRLPFLLELLAI